MVLEQRKLGLIDIVVLALRNLPLNRLPKQLLKPIRQQHRILRQIRMQPLQQILPHLLYLNLHNSPPHLPLPSLIIHLRIPITLLGLPLLRTLRPHSSQILYLSSSILQVGMLEFHDHLVVFPFLYCVLSFMAVAGATEASWSGAAAVFEGLLHYHRC